MNTQVNSIRAEISELRDYLDGLPTDLRAGEYGQSYCRRLALLLEQLAEHELIEAANSTKMPAIDLSVTTGKLPEGGRIRAQLLGDLLQRWQTLFFALAQAAAGRATSRGTVPIEIRQEVTFDVVAYAPGSFVTRLVIEEPPQSVLPETGLGVEAFDWFQKLSSAGAEHRELEPLLHKLRGRVLSSYSRLLDLLHHNGASMNVAMAEPQRTRVRRVRLDHAVVGEILPALAAVSAAEETPADFIGILNAANRRIGTFEFDLGEDGTITGRGDPGILEGVTIGDRYQFTVSQVLATDKLTGEVDTRWYLLKVESVQE